jgi:putative flavoprotein involved in K+ transport
MDVGACAMIADGRVRVVAGEVARMDGGSVFVRAGGEGGGETELAADLVVACTGFSNMCAWAEKFCGPEVAEKVGPVYGYGSGTRGDPGPCAGTWAR